ncbi:MAG: hypothetical protein R3F59_29220 [Myxococcota bacterium]
MEHQIRWIPGDGSTALAVRSIGAGTPGWRNDAPNGLDRFDADGRSYLLQTTRGDWAGGWANLWDITDPAAPAHVWRYPASGGLDAPHAPLLRRFGGRWWLLYAHAGLGTLGLAVTDEVTALPAYVADLAPEDGPFDFLRGVDLDDDGWLWLTDSGPGDGLSVEPRGRVLRARMPEGLQPTGASGSFLEPLARETLPDVVLLADGLVNPFEGWLWVPGG